jgi:hypothetical protein
MKYQFVICTFAVLALGCISPLFAQQDEVKLDAAQSKITTVSAMRARKAPQITAEEIVRLKLGTVVNAVARSTAKDTIGDKTDYWYRVNLPNGATGWLFGGLLLEYNASQRQALLRQIIETRLKVEETEFADRQELYNLAASSINEAKDVNARAEFELLKLLALANWARTFPHEWKDKSADQRWRKAHAAEVIPNEFGGGYNMRSELLWNLEAKYHTLPIADRIAWAAAENPQPSDCEGDEVCHFFLFSPVIKYLNLHPHGAHAAEALTSLNEVLTGQVIDMANSKGGDQYVVEQRNDLKKLLASARLALAKTSGVEKAEILKKLERVTSTR